MGCPEQKRETQDHQKSQWDRKAVLREQKGKEHSSETHHRADRQVDPGSDNDEGRTDTDNPKQSAAANQVFNVVGSQEAIAQQRCEDADGDEQPQDSKDFFS